MSSGAAGRNLGIKRRSRGTMDESRPDKEPRLMVSRSGDAEFLTPLDTLCRLGVVGELSDGELLRRLRRSDPATSQAIFGVLVERHGPMVLRACQRVLGDSHDA